MKTTAHVMPTIAFLSLYLLCQGCGGIKGHLPGETMIATPEETAKERKCWPNQPKKLLLESGEVSPDEVKPGEEVGTRIVYAFCPEIPGKAVNCRLTRRVLDDKKALFVNSNSHLFHPGTWEIVAFIRIPAQAKEGDYTLQTEIACGDKIYLQRTDSFEVEK